MSARLVAASDDSPASLQAARLLAGYEGDRSGLVIVALNVQARPLTLWPGPAVDPGKIDEALLREGEIRLEPAYRLLVQAGFAPERAVRLGIPAESIADEAMRRGATAIVMGTRGHGALRGFALGSVSLRVAHRAHVPVILVQPDSLFPAALGRSLRVLVSLDGSAHATRAVSCLLGWSDWLGGLEVDLAHIRSASTAWANFPSQERELLDRWGSREAEQATRDARALLYTARIDHRLHEAQGDVCEQIVQFAAQLGSELIVMGTRGLGAIHHALIGSNTLKVAHASPVPVVLVP